MDCWNSDDLMVKWVGQRCIPARGRVQDAECRLLCAHCGVQEALCKQQRENIEEGCKKMVQSAGIRERVAEKMQINADSDSIDGGRQY